MMILAVFRSRSQSLDYATRLTSFGVRAETVSACKHRVTIPMTGRAESLNASMAAGIILWEMCRSK